MPAVAAAAPRSTPPPRFDIPAATVERGRKVYAENCFVCHGLGARSSGLVPDLRTASPETHRDWDAIVRGGVRSDKGMPSFADRVSAEDAQAVRAYVLDRAWHEPGPLERMVGVFVDHACVPVSWATD